jgi:acyl-coenzyme A thioesterase PaaI-like protein
MGKQHHKERERSMLDISEVRQFIVQAVPFNQVLGITIAHIAPESVEVVLPEAPERRNHVGTVHAAAQFGLGEATSGTLVVAAFGDLFEQGIVPLAAKATITYRKAASGELRGTAFLSLQEQQRIRDEVVREKRSRFTLPVQLMKSDGSITTELEVSWSLLKQQ